MNKKLKIFVDAHLMDGPMQGSRTYIKELYRELILSNPDVEFYFGANDTDTLKNEIGEGNNVRFLKYHSSNKYLRLAVIIPWLILKHKIDVAHYQYITPLFKFSTEIVTIHDVLFMDFPRLFPALYRLKNRILFRRAARRADYLLTVSEYSRERIAFHFNVDISDIYVVPNGVSKEYFETEGHLPDVKQKYNLEKYILYVSRIEPRKNHVMLARAFTEMELWRSGFKLVFLGVMSIDTPEFTSYLKVIPAEIKECILVIPESRGLELISFYKNCTLFVYPSLAEGFGIPPLEAAALKVPVLCSNSTSMKEFSFFGDGHFNPESQEELKNKIMQKLSLTGPADNNISELIRKQYTWESAAGIFSEVIIRSCQKN